MRLFAVLCLSLVAAADLFDEETSPASITKSQIRVERCGNGVVLAFGGEPAIARGDFDGDGKSDLVAVVELSGNVKLAAKNAFGYGNQPEQSRALAIIWGGAERCDLLGGETPALYADPAQRSGSDLLSVRPISAKMGKGHDEIIVETQAGAGSLRWRSGRWNWREEPGSE